MAKKEKELLEEKEELMPQEQRFTKEQFLKSDASPFNKDVLQILLEEEQMYTKEEVSALVKAFNEREVE